MDQVFVLNSLSKAKRVKDVTNVCETATIEQPARASNGKGCGQVAALCRWPGGE